MFSHSCSSLLFSLSISPPLCLFQIERVWQPFYWPFIFIPCSFALLRGWEMGDTGISKSIRRWKKAKKKKKKRSILANPPFLKGYGGFQNWITRDSQRSWTKPAKSALGWISFRLSVQYGHDTECTVDAHGNKHMQTPRAITIEEVCKMQKLRSVWS